MIKVVAELRNWLHHGTCKSAYSQGGLGWKAQGPRFLRRYLCDERSHVKMRLWTDHAKEDPLEAAAQIKMYSRTKQVTGRTRHDGCLRAVANEAFDETANRVL